MTSRALLVPVSVRALAAAATLLALSALLASCGDAEEDIGPDAQPSGAASPSPSTSPVVLTATPVATTPPGWQTYVDPVMGFSFPHPAGLEARDLAPQPSGASIRPDSPLRALEFRPEGGNPVIAVSVYQNPAGLTPLEWAHEFVACHFDEPFPVNDISVHGAPGITCVTEAVAGMFSNAAVLSLDGRIFLLDAVLSDPEFAAVLDGLVLSP